MASVPEDKVCDSCGRSFSWRKKWRDDWDSVRYCSAACRKQRVRSVDENLENAILELLAQRGAGKTICPSEAARRVAPDDWRSLMEPTRRAARRLCARGDLEITQRGRVVDPSSARGAIRLRRR